MLLVKIITLTVSIRITIPTTTMEAPSKEITTIRTTFTLNTNSRQQNTGHSHNQTDTQNQSQRQQNFNNNNSNPRPQNHTCSNNQISLWIRLQVQLQAIPVIFYTDDESKETYALLDSGSDNTQITNSMAKALGVKNTDHIAVPISSLYGEHIITSAEVLLGIGSLNSTRPLFDLPVYATSAYDLQMLSIPQLRC